MTTHEIANLVRAAKLLMELEQAGVTAWLREGGDESVIADEIDRLLADMKKTGGVS